MAGHRPALETTMIDAAINRISNARLSWCIRHLTRVGPEFCGIRHRHCQKYQRQRI